MGNSYRSLPIDLLQKEKTTEVYENDNFNISVTSAQGKRYLNQDEFDIALEVNNFTGSWFGLYDGHSGSESSKMAKYNLLSLVNFEGPGSLIDKVILGFLKFNEVMYLQTKEKNTSGTTANVILTIKDYFICFNLGDTRSLLIKNNGYVIMSKDQKPNNPEEEKIIKLGGGKVKNNRINGTLGTGRAFGNFKLEEMISSLPEYKICKRSKKDLFLIIACDGLWDVLNNDEVYEIIIKECENNVETKIISEKLVDLALERGSTDNITIILIKIKN
ncbi:MAG: hypothetical protein CMF62_04150 [Magnetococcales bacterium]|nr:hypothetical protein [Magnetococcales bacterium]|tara:strand:+ start:25062 stop:25883 length:822 start_codon:yes stop_codon:yes gene_type:complete